MATILQKKRAAVKKPAPCSTAVKTARKAPARPLATIHLSESMAQMLTTLAKKQNKSVAYVAEHLIEEALEAQDDEFLERYGLSEAEFLNPPTLKAIEAGLEQSRCGQGTPVTVEALKARLAQIIEQSKISK